MESLINEEPRNEEPRNEDSRKKQLSKEDSKKVDIFVLQFQTLDDFCDMVPDDYHYKKHIQERCRKIKESLSYTAPESLFNTWKYIYKLSEFKPKSENSWSNEAWGILNNTTNLINHLSNSN